MNIEFSFVDPPTGIHNVTGGRRGPAFTDTQVATTVAAKLATKTSDKAALITELETACAAAERDLKHGIGNSQHSGTIRVLEQRITRLEGEIEYFTRAAAALPPV